VIQDDPGLNKDIKMLGVAAGNDAKQIAVYKKQFRVVFPVLPDKDHKIRGFLGSPLTPFMLVANTQGKVLLTHVGIIEDLDGMLKEIRELHKSQ